MIICACSSVTCKSCNSNHWLAPFTVGRGVRGGGGEERTHMSSENGEGWYFTCGGSDEVGVRVVV